VLEAERAMLCGPRYAHLIDRHAMRSGQVDSSPVMGGRRVEVRRPRAAALMGMS